MVALFKAGLIRAVSFDVTGTLVTHKHPCVFMTWAQRCFEAFCRQRPTCPTSPGSSIEARPRRIAQTYAECATWARIPNAPTAEAMKPAFKRAYKQACEDKPSFGGAASEDREWWWYTVRLALEYCGCEVSDAEFARYFRRVYQHYGSHEGYEVLPDAKPALLALQGRGVLVGVTSNTPRRTSECVLPMLGLHEQMRFYATAQECAAEKPALAIFQLALDEARVWLPDLEPAQILHVGDSLEADYCGARAAGLSALHLDRSANPKVTKYQDWLAAPDYPGKSEADIRDHTITNLDQLVQALGSP